VVVKIKNKENTSIFNDNMTHTKLYAEEQIINQETVNIQEILNREEFKQPIPTEFIKLKVEEGNYMGSTK